MGTSFYMLAFQHNTNTVASAFPYDIPTEI